MDATPSYLRPGRLLAAWAAVMVAAVIALTSCGDNTTLQVDRSESTLAETSTVLPSPSAVPQQDDDGDTAPLRGEQASEESTEVAPEAVSGETATDETATDETATDETPTDETVTTEPTPAAATAASPCKVLLPVTPAADATGVVTFDLTGEWSAYNYGELYVLDEDGESALVAGKPAVRNRDSFAFVINSSMYGGANEADVRVSFNGDPIVSCDVEFTDLATVTADEGGGSGY